MDTEGDTPPHRRAKVNAQGRVVIPAEFRRALGIEADSEVIIVLDNDLLTIQTPAAVIERIHQLAAPFKTKTSIVDELIAERRAAARREEGPPPKDVPLRRTG